MSLFCICCWDRTRSFGTTTKRWAWTLASRCLVGSQWSQCGNWWRIWRSATSLSRWLESTESSTRGASPSFKSACRTLPNSGCSNNVLTFWRSMLRKISSGGCFSTKPNKPQKTSIIHRTKLNRAMLKKSVSAHQSTCITANTQCSSGTLCSTCCTSPSCSTTTPTTHHTPQPQPHHTPQPQPSEDAFRSCWFQLKQPSTSHPSYLSKPKNCAVKWWPIWAIISRDSQYPRSTQISTKTSSKC